MAAIHLLPRTSNQPFSSVSVIWKPQQLQVLQKNVDGALNSYNELVKEDPKEFRPYFCRGMIYSLLDRNAEAKEQFEKYRQLSPKKFEVDGYLRKPLSRMKLFGSEEN